MKTKHMRLTASKVANFTGTLVSYINSGSLNIAQTRLSDDEATEEEVQHLANLMAEAPLMYETLVEIRTWYEKNQERYLGTDTPVCFSKALSRILAIQKVTKE